MPESELSLVHSILSALDWDEGISIPVANAENRELEEELQRKQRAIIKHETEISNHEDRLHIMKEHLKNVNQELVHTQALLRARENELETENHMTAICEREDGRLKQEMRRLENQLVEHRDQRNALENTIFRQSKRMDELKGQLDWDHQALEAWLEESAKKDEDAMTLAKYARMDDEKTKELILRIEKMTDDCGKKRRYLDQEVTSTLTAQLELDKVAEEFRKAHSERQDVIERWEHTIAQMKTRDEQMNDLSVELATAKQDVLGKQDELKEKREFLEKETDNNVEKEKQIFKKERISAKLREEYVEMERDRVALQDEMETLKRTVDRTATDLEIMRGEITLLKKDHTAKQRRLTVAEENRNILTEKLKRVTITNLTAEEKAHAMDKMLDEEEKVMSETLAEINRLKETQFKKQQELFQTENRVKDLDSELSGNRITIKNMNIKVTKLDTDTIKQQEIMYNQDFQVQALKRRIARLLGELSTEEETTLNKKIAELNAILDGKNATYQLLDLQSKRLYEDIRKVKRQLGSSDNQKAELCEKILEVNLYNDSSTRELQALNIEKQDLMVDENLLKLRVKRNRGNLTNYADKVLSLEKRRQQLETAMKERRIEIKIHQDMLKAQLKSANEERQTLNAELYDRNSKVEKLRKRYEILVVSMAPGEEDEDKSAAYYVIKAAQEKEELQRKGDKLDANIRKAEKEIRALENTLRLLNGRNEVYRKSFNKVTESSEDWEEKEKIDQQLRTVMDKLKYKRRVMRELQDDIDRMGNTLDTLVNDGAIFSETIEERTLQLQRMNREVRDLDDKIDRSQRQCAKLAREIRKSRGQVGTILEEKDIELRELKEFNRYIAGQFNEAAVVVPEMGNSVDFYLSQAGVPSGKPGGTGASPSDSARSSVSSSSSLSSQRHSAVRAVDMAAQFSPPPSGSGSSRSGRVSLGSSRATPKKR